MKRENLTVCCSKGLKEAINNTAYSLGLSTSSLVRVVLARLTGQPASKQDYQADEVIEQYIQKELGILHAKATV
jgi:hypothetical protein